MCFCFALPRVLHNMCRSQHHTKPYYQAIWKTDKIWYHFIWCIHCDISVTWMWAHCEISVSLVWCHVVFIHGITRKEHPNSNRSMCGIRYDLWKQLSETVCLLVVFLHNTAVPRTSHIPHILPLAQVILSPSCLWYIVKMKYCIRISNSFSWISQRNWLLLFAESKRYMQCICAMCLFWNFW